jgi:hypothetical protein
MHDHIKLGCYFLNDPLQSRFNRGVKHCTPILGAPNETIFESRNCPGIAPIPIHARHYTRGGQLVATTIRAATGSFLKKTSADQENSNI